jgi:hypothetical protein
MQGGMNRELKFRAWDNERKHFVPEGEIVFSFYGDTRIEVHPNSIEYIGDSCHSGEPQRGRFVVTQYTGVKDNNEIEIFEGDKVKHLDEVGTVIYNSCTASFDFQYEGGDCDLLIESDKTILEVVGNIFEDAA